MFNWPFLYGTRGPNRSVGTYRNKGKTNRIKSHRNEMKWNESSRIDIYDYLINSIIGPATANACVCGWEVIALVFYFLLTIPSIGWRWRWFNLHSDIFNLLLIWHLKFVQKFYENPINGNHSKFSALWQKLFTICQFEWIKYCHERKGRMKKLI